MKTEQEQDLKRELKELVSTDAPDLWKTFKDGVLKACDKMCAERRSL